MSSRQLRFMFRYGHTIEGILIGIYIYSPTMQSNPTYANFIQFVIFPFIVFSGVMMWQMPRINKWRSQRRRAMQNS